MRQALAAWILFVSAQYALATLSITGSTIFSTNNQITSFTLNRPASVNIGDLLLVEIGYTGTGTTVSPPPPFPLFSGWTVIRNDANNPAHQYLFYHFADFFDVLNLSSTSWSLSGNSRVVATMIGVRSSSTSNGNIQLGANSLSNGTGNVLTASSVTATASGMLLRFYSNGYGDGSTAFTNNSSLTTLASGFTNGNGSGTTLLAGYRLIGAGATNTDTITSGNSSQWIAQTLLLIDPAPAGVAAFRISHSGSGINCASSPVTITAVDTSGNAVSNYTGTIAITTSASHGTWTLNTGSGVFAAGAADSGQAAYTFTAADNGAVILNLSDTHAESININVTNGSVSEDSNYDPSLIFRPTGLRFVANGARDAIPHQIAGRAFSSSAIGSAYTNAFQLEAVGTDPSNNQCTALFNNGAQTVNVAAECQNPTTCLSNLSIGGTIIAKNAANTISSYTPLTLNFTNGFAPLGSINYSDAGQLKLYANALVTISGQSTTVTGASNPFVVAPFGFCISPSSAANNNPNATDANGTVFTTAGTDFSTTLKAVTWDSADDINNDGVADGGADLCAGTNGGNAVAPNFGRHIAAPAVSISATLQQPSPGNGVLLTGNTAITTAFTNPGNGQAQTDVNWSEVGIITLNAQSGDYLNSGLVISGRRTNVGRFIPHHFAISNKTLTNRSDLSSCASAFTYLDEPLKLSYTIEARNASDGVTQNYAGAFAKFPATISETPAPGNVSTTLSFAAISTGGTRTPLTPTLAGNLTPNFSSGKWNVDANVIVAKSSIISSYTTTAFGVAPKDSDNVTTTGFDIDTSAPADTNDHVQIGTNTDLLYGRLRVNSVSGPVDLPLPVPITAEYWNNSSAAFLMNAADNCTPIDGAANATPIAFHGSLNNGETTASGSGLLVQGKAPGPSFPNTLSWSAPGAGNEGSVDFIFNISGMPWLRFDWDNNAATADTDPAATASFGIYRGSDRVIYWQETQ